jgi:hypothetical protein
VESDVEREPLSPQPSSHGTTIRWPELLIGKELAEPCRMPSTSARAALTRAPLGQRR